MFAAKHLLHSNSSKYSRRHTGDTGIEQEHDYYDEPRHRYSLSDMITHLKRSIPDLRSIKHQPLQNKESPSGSPRASQYRLDPERNLQSASYSHQPPSSSHYRRESTTATAAAASTTSHHCHGVDDPEKETDAITLSAVAIRTCSCGASKETSGDKNPVVDELDAFPTNHRSNAELRYTFDPGTIQHILIFYCSYYFYIYYIAQLKIRSPICQYA